MFLNSLIFFKFFNLISYPFPIPSILKNTFSTPNANKSLSSVKTTSAKPALAK